MLESISIPWEFASYRFSPPLGAVLELNLLVKNLKKDFSGLRIRKVALLADSSTQLLGKALRGYGHGLGFSFEIFEAYDQTQMQILDSRSDFHQFAADYAVLLPCIQKLKARFMATPQEARSGFAETYLDFMQTLWQALTLHTQARILQSNFPESGDSVFGNFANKTDLSFLYQLRKINLGIMDAARNTEGIYVNDVASLQGSKGSLFCQSPRYYIHADMAFAPDFLPDLARNLVSIIMAMEGGAKKVLILDLDNTLWGGIIGEDGLEKIQMGNLGVGKAFTQFQAWVCDLRARGIILAICSKNDEIVAREPFLHHPDMLLKLEDIAVFVANWENKAENIRRIQENLNLSFDSMVFLDDSPFERNLVRQLLPEVTVPELPEDPSEYISYLENLNLFESSSFTAEDRSRTQFYQEEISRKNLQVTAITEEDYLQGLNLEATVETFRVFNLPRIAQLSQRSNQFNLRTIRFTEEEAKNLAESLDYRTAAFTLKDKFGDYGLVSVGILRIDKNEAFIHSWFMSCRVLKRGMETFVLNHLANLAQAAGCTHLSGEYIPTAKNGMVKDFYADLGFVKDKLLWTLQLSDFIPKINFIKEV